MRCHRSFRISAPRPLLPAASSSWTITRDVTQAPCHFTNSLVKNWKGRWEALRARFRKILFDGETFATETPRSTPRASELRRSAVHDNPKCTFDGQGDPRIRQLAHVTRNGGFRFFPDPPYAMTRCAISTPMYLIAIERTVGRFDAPTVNSHAKLPFENGKRREKREAGATRPRTSANMMRLIVRRKIWRQRRGEGARRTSRRTRSPPRKTFRDTNDL